MTIRFYSASDEYGCFSSFYPCQVTIDGKTWPTTEHYFQAQKFRDQAQQEAIRRAKTPKIAATMGRDRKKKLRRDWESVKVDVMRKAVREKFTQDPQLREMLLSTGDQELVEHTARDKYWGDGGDGRGRNILGRILMNVREELRERFRQ